MSGWVQLLIILVFAFGPILSKILQTIGEKQQEVREKKRREVAAREAETAVLRSGPTESQSEAPAPSYMSSAEESRRAELARRRQAQLEAWRAKQRRRGMLEQESEGGDQAEIHMPGTMIEGQSGDSLIREAFGETSTPHRRPQAPPRPRSIPGRPTPVAVPSRSSGSNAPRPAIGTRAGTAQQAALERLERAQQARRELERQIAAGRAPEGEIAATAIGTGAHDPYRLSGEDLVRYHRLQFLRKMLRSQESLRQAFLLKEVLDRPIGMRDKVGHADWV